MSGMNPPNGGRMKSNDLPFMLTNLRQEILRLHPDKSIGFRSG